MSLRTATAGATRPVASRVAVAKTLPQVMAAIVTLQLTPAEMQVVAEVCRTDGHTIRALTPTALQGLVDMPTACLIAADHDDNELRTVRRAIASAPQHWYAVGAPVGARQPMCSIMSDPEVLPFFLPPPRG